MLNLRAVQLGKRLWNYLCYHESLKKADLILILGGGDVRVFDYGIFLWEKHFAPLLAFSGGGSTRESFKVYKKSEAEAFLDLVKKKGLSQEKIIVEDTSNNTHENLLNTKKILEKRKIYPQSVILVQEPYTEMRLRLTCEKIWPQVHCQVTAPLEMWEERCKSKEYCELMINEVVGNIQRLKIYSKKKDIADVFIPHDVLSAYEELLSMGFKRFLL